MDKFVIFHIDGGCGKNIIGTAVVKSIKAAYPEHKIIVVCGYPEVFLHNPNVYRIYRFGNNPYFYDDYIYGKESVILRMEPYHSGDLLYKRKSLAQIWCDVFNIKCVSETPELFISENEYIPIHAQLNKQGPILMVQSSGGAENQPHPYSWARDLPPPFAQEVVDAVRGNFDRVIHIRRENQIGINDTFHLSDNFRNLFCFISLADKLLCIDSFAQHAAAALNKPAVVGWISNSPVVFGHKIHKNILPKEPDAFRHKPDCYLETDDWTGSRFYECPYSNINSIFDKDEFVEAILGKKDQDLLFAPNPTIVLK